MNKSLNDYMNGWIHKQWTDNESMDELDKANEWLDEWLNQMHTMILW